MISALRFARHQDRHIRGEAHEARGIARRQGDIRDVSVVGMSRIDPKMRGTVDLLVGSCSAEGSPLGERLLLVYLKGQYRHRCLPSIGRFERPSLTDIPRIPGALWT